MNLGTSAPVEDLTPSQLLERVRDRREEMASADVDVLRCALAWADAHPELGEDGQPVPAEVVPDGVLAAHFAGLDPEDDPGSPSWAGLPRVDWAAVIAFAACEGLSTHAGAAYLRDALILRHRLPATYDRVLEGSVPIWRARRVAQAVAGAPEAVVTALDSVVAPRAETIGTVALDRLIGEAMVRLYPEVVEAASLQALEARYVRFDHQGIGHTGVARMQASADFADLDDLDRTLTELADRLAEVDPDTAQESLDVRRAKALGLVADPHRAADLLDHEPSPEPSDVPKRRRRTDLILRISEHALLGTDPVGREDTTGQVTLADRIAAWAGRPASDLTVLPVVDPDQHHTTEAYEIRGGFRRQVDERDRHCLFPFCTRPARDCDHDHVVPFDEGGASCSCNIIPLCRRHHRLKTLGNYQVSVVEPGLVWWITPHRHQFVVDSHGTRTIDYAHPTEFDGCLNGHDPPSRAA